MIVSYPPGCLPKPPGSLADESLSPPGGIHTPGEGGNQGALNLFDGRPSRRQARKALSFGRRFQSVGARDGRLSEEKAPECPFLVGAGFSVDRLHGLGTRIQTSDSADFEVRRPTAKSANRRSRPTIKQLPSRERRRGRAFDVPDIDRPRDGIDPCPRPKGEHSNA